MSFCPNCGKSIAEQATKCISCGHDLGEKAKAARFKGTMMMAPAAVPTAQPTPAPAPVAAPVPVPAAPVATAAPFAEPTKAPPISGKSAMKGTILGTGGAGFAPLRAPTASAASVAPLGAPPPPAASVSIPDGFKAPGSAPVGNRSQAPAAFADTGKQAAEPPTRAAAPQAAAQASVQVAAPTPVREADDSQRMLVGDPMARPQPAPRPEPGARRTSPAGVEDPPISMALAIGFGIVVIALVGYAVARYMGLTH